LLTSVAADTSNNQGQLAQGFPPVFSGRQQLQLTHQAGADACVRIVPVSLGSIILVCLDSSLQFYELPNIFILKSFSG